MTKQPSSANMLTLVVQHQEIHNLDEKLKNIHRPVLINFNPINK